MLQEIEKMSQDELSTKLDKSDFNIKGQADNQYDVPNEEKVFAPHRSRSLFAVQLFICSILLWTLLFVKDSNYGKVYLDRMTQVLSEDTKIESIQRGINQLTLAIQQLI